MQAAERNYESRIRVGPEPAAYLFIMSSAAEKADRAFRYHLCGLCLGAAEV